ncbi:MAG: tRNA-specific 2-thiouridylase MnmA [Parcubacteria group bacterium GW2011_GWF2_42_7]|nr:MAG: tRNA-specific 2-thiouridylase MnmA [Parcubacteria group bacterium GW2011_GWF2_42_7]
MRKKIVFVGLSGGVDSAVSAALLQKTGYEVGGVFIRTWHPEFLECNEEEERRDAMRVAAHLDIPFLTFDLEDVYKKEVADYMIAEYKAGRTPNPDVMCNQEVKFGAFLKKAILMGADYVATGHYAQDKKLVLSHGSHSILNVADRALVTNAEESTVFYLAKGVDTSKDQSYFLWTLKQEQLSKIIFPVGHLKKIEVRRLAKKFKLPNALKKDSQGICFLGAVDLKEFLRHYIKEKKGKVLNQKDEEIGYHNGVVFSTLGERHGFTITKKSPNNEPHYVVGKDVKKNILFVSAKKDFSYSNILTNISIKSTNWISGTPITYNLKPKIYSCQIRYHGEFLPCKIICRSRTSAEVIFNKPVMVAPGQSCVIYDNDICFGGGVVI